MQEGFPFLVCTDPVSQPSTLPNAPHWGCTHLKDPPQNVDRTEYMHQIMKPKHRTRIPTFRGRILQVWTARMGKRLVRMWTRSSEGQASPVCWIFDWLVPGSVKTVLNTFDHTHPWLNQNINDSLKCWMKIGTDFNKISNNLLKEFFCFY